MPIVSSHYRHDRFCLRLSVTALPSLISLLKELIHFNLSTYGMQLIETKIVDITAFDPKNPYFDSK